MPVPTFLKIVGSVAVTLATFRVNIRLPDLHFYFVYVERGGPTNRPAPEQQPAGGKDSQ